jgi:hypothetical protein
MGQLVPPTARQLAELIRSRDPEQAAAAATELMGPAAVAAAVVGLYKL